MPVANPGAPSSPPHLHNADEPQLDASKYTRFLHRGTHSASRLALLSVGLFMLVLGILDFAQGRTATGIIMLCGACVPPPFFLFACVFMLTVRPSPPPLSFLPPPAFFIPIICVSFQLIRKYKLGFMFASLLLSYAGLSRAVLSANDDKNLDFAFQMGLHAIVFKATLVVFAAPSRLEFLVAGVADALPAFVIAFAVREPTDSTALFVLLHVGAIVLGICSTHWLRFVWWQVYRYVCSLHATHQQFKFLSMYSKDMVCVLSLEGSFLFCSTAVEGLLGVTEQQLLGRHISDLAVSQDRDRVSKFIRAHVNRAASQQQPRSPAARGLSRFTSKRAASSRVRCSCLV